MALFRQPLFSRIALRQVKLFHSSSMVASIARELEVDRADPRLDKEDPRKGYKFDEVANIRSLLQGYMATPASDRALNTSQRTGGNGFFAEEMEDAARKMEDNVEQTSRKILTFFKGREVTKPRPRPTLATPKYHQQTSAEEEAAKEAARTAAQAQAQQQARARNPSLLQQLANKRQKKAAPKVKAFPEPARALA